MIKDVLLSALLLGAASSVWSAEPAPANDAKPVAKAPATNSQTPAANCRSLVAEERKECEQAGTRKKSSSATKDESLTRAAPVEQTPLESSSSSSPHDPQAVMHSSPIMQTAEERAVEKALREGKDPVEAVKEVQRQSN